VNIITKTDNFYILLIIFDCGTLLCSIKTYFMLNLFIFQFLDQYFMNKFSYATVALKQRHVVELLSVSDRTDATEITAIGRGSFSVYPRYVGSPPIK
jgi:hypothetical protein